MAKNNETTTKFKVDITELKQGITEANRQIRLANAQFKSASSGMDDWAHSADGISAKLNQLETVLTNEDKKLQALEKQLELTARQFGENSAEADELRIKIANQQAVVNKTTSDIKKYQGILSDLSDEAEDTAEELEDVGDSAKKASDGFGIMQVAIGSLIADGLKALASSVKDTMQEIILETGYAYDSFQAKTGVATESMAEFEDVMNDLYKNNYGESLDDIAQSMAEIKQQTGETDPTKLKELTENALALRDTFDFDVKESMRAVNMLMTQFGITGEEAYNLIVQGAQQGLDKNGDLLDTINEYSVHYQQLGYDSDEFFNSLINGSKSGTFSVDKLGDAMKEFGIRTKDTATTTTEGFELLGYGVEATSEEIDKQKDKIADLEKKLSYATQEQSNFNDKTSDLKRQKMADTIAKYSSELEEAKGKLVDMEKTTGDNVKSAEELRAEFAKGGESAKKATKEVLEKLLAMDDQVAQNQAGVDLFGTMWEDLGIEGVKALVNTNGELSKTKQSMEELKEIQYDNVKSKFTQIGRTIKMDLLVPLAEKLIPKVEKFTNYLIENSDEVINKLKVIGTMIATVFVINKLAVFIKSLTTMVTTFKTLKTAIQASTVAQKALNAVQSASPIGALITAVGLLAGAFLLLRDDTDEVREKYAKLTEAEQANKDAVDKLAESYRNVKDAVDKSVADTQAQFTYYDSLLTELDGLVDANGRVKEGYEERANFIITTLNNALGTELEMTDKVIGNYQEQRDALIELMNTKKAQIILQANEQAYTDAITNQTEAFNTLIDAQNNLKNVNDELKTAQEEYNALKNTSLQQFAEENDLTGLAGHIIHNFYNTALDSAKSKVEGLSDKQNELNGKFETAEDALINYNTTIENYEGLSSAIISGDTDKINDSLNKLINGFITAENGTQRTLENQVKNMKLNYENLKKAVENGAPGVTQEMVDTARDMVNASILELGKFEGKAETEGEKGGEAVAEGISNKEGEVKKAGKNAGEKAKEGIEEVDTEESGENFIQGFIDSMGDNTLLNKLSNAVKGVGKSIVGWFNKSLGENSPSKLTKQSGKYFLAGFGNGLDDNIKKLGNKVKSMGSSLVDNFNVGVDTSSIKSGLLSSNIYTGAVAGATQVTNNYNFNQTNNSPKALNRLELYRQTRNQFNYAVGR